MGMRGLVGEKKTDVSFQLILVLQRGSTRLEAVIYWICLSPTHPSPKKRTDSKSVAGFLLLGLIFLQNPSLALLQAHLLSSTNKIVFEIPIFLSFFFVPFLLQTKRKETEILKPHLLGLSFLVCSWFVSNPTEGHGNQQEFPIRLLWVHFLPCERCNQACGEGFQAFLPRLGRRWQTCCGDRSGSGRLLIAHIE
mmetsp:Transcript_30575/g.79746  ORF Transcript_30575/g.79746 Transcript_30575/m.79746 type:complete len:194 (-) Transcript_30575:1038-1619(-)